MGGQMFTVQEHVEDTTISDVDSQTNNYTPESLRISTSSQQLGGGKSYESNTASTSVNQESVDTAVEIEAQSRIRNGFHPELRGPNGSILLNAWLIGPWNKKFVQVHEISSL